MTSASYTGHHASSDSEKGKNILKWNHKGIVTMITLAHISPR